jgi:hypothetical protein
VRHWCDTGCLQCRRHPLNHYRLIPREAIFELWKHFGFEPTTLEFVAFERRRPALSADRRLRNRINRLKGQFRHALENAAAQGNAESKEAGARIVAGLHARRMRLERLCTELEGIDAAAAEDLRKTLLGWKKGIDGLRSSHDPTFG